LSPTDVGQNYGPDWAVKNSLEFPHPQGAPLPQLRQ